MPASPGLNQSTKLLATLADPVFTQLPDRSWLNRSVLTAGGAAGMAVDRDNGRVRIEVEGRGRDDVAAAYAGQVDSFTDADLRWAAADGWSALVNVWRDYTVTEHVDVYLGGGLGGGGYRYSFGGRVDSPGPGDITYSIVRPTAFFKSLAGQVCGWVGLSVGMMGWVECGYGGLG